MLGTCVDLTKISGGSHPTGRISFVLTIFSASTHLALFRLMLSKCEAAGALTLQLDYLASVCMNGTFRKGVKLITPPEIYSAPYSYGALTLRGGNCLNRQNTPYPYAFVRVDIALNAFRHVISRNLPDSPPQ